MGVSGWLNMSREACPWQGGGGRGGGGGGGGGGAWQVLSLLQRHTESIQNLWRVRRAADHVAILLFWGLRLGPILLHH